MDIQEVQGASATPEEQAGLLDGNQDGGAQTATPDVTVYTPEEIAEILANDGELDRKRLSPEGQLIQKSFERGLTPKFQEIADLRKTLELAIAPKSQDPLDGWVDNYIKDPEGVATYVDNQIRHLESITPDPALDYEGYRRVRAEIAAFNGDFSRVQARARGKETTQAKLQAVPQDLKEYAKSQGFTEKELLDPKIANALKALHRFETAGKGLQAVPKKPSEVVGAGTGLVQSSNTVQLNAVRKQVEANPTTDNIAALLAAKRKTQT